MPTLEWIGKNKVINHHLEVPLRTLDCVYEYGESNGSDGSSHSGNMIVHGDNLEALKALLPEYEGRVSCVYIDPPYNTGNEGWVYNDNVNDPKIRKWIGEVVGSEDEDLSRHDKWLCMMYPRLRLLYKLLADDGAIFISIDDNEYANLKLICDEIFGKNNYVGTIIWQKRTSPDARKRISNGHEYIVLYAKDASDLEAVLNLVPLNEDDARKYRNPENDPNGPWVSVDFTAQGFRPNQMYEIETPSGKVIGPPEGRCWKNPYSVYEELRDSGRLWFGESGDGVPRQKNYLRDKPGKTTWTWWPNTEVGHTQEATQELASMLGKAVFDYPKPTRLIERILQIATDKDSIVLDSFAGSGTTAHAVLNVNRVDGGNRRFILVEMMDYAESITAERVRCVIDGYGEGKKAVEGTGGRFGFYELGERMFKEDGSLNEAVGAERIRAYVWYTETGRAFEPPTGGNPYHLGDSNGTGYYFHYEPDAATALDYAFLSTITERQEGYVIYADTCSLSEDELAEFGITFKKIPRDIARL
ncbi:MAG: site-specific DNA-methyltransferase [Kiritimatiellae bacterium]|nr:site-specific DNA-methyltransferase [Kiritimatiellia bacterium]